MAVYGRPAEIRSRSHPPPCYAWRMATEQHAPRPLDAAELDSFLELDEIVFTQSPVSPELSAVDRDLLELDRTIGVFAGAEIVAGASIFTFSMTVPGGRIPMAGVSWVSVLPTHRRRGILSAMMRHQLHGLHESGGEPVAALTASEPPIYGRYGYGPATQAAVLSVPRHHNALRLPDGVDDVTLRMVPTAESQPVCAEIFAREVDRRPGMLELTPGWARVSVADLAEWREGRSRLRTILAERDGRPVGFARYRTKSDFKLSGPNGRVDVDQIIADDPAAYAALLRYVLDIDLTSSTQLYRIPVDSPALHLLMNLRAADLRLDDVLYVRLVDVDRALAARTYAAQIDLVIEVADLFCPWNDGRWRLTGDEKGARCERTDAAPDLALGVRELGAAYLGGTSLSALARAGLVEERRTGAVSEAARAFASELAPWLPYGF
jgi:predicted acetyltransferase